jgi:hypothetical protein
MAPVRDLTPGSDGADRGAEEIRDRHPADPAWRADALGASRHRRLADEIPQPKDDFDTARAEALCAEICREALRDYAPGLALLTPADRRRAQALTAYTRTLFDFARQRGLEGERLAQINRWEFTLESALSGRPVGQPVFVAMARCEGERPWPREALDELATAARRSVTRDAGHPWTVDDDRRLASALLAAWMGADAYDAVAEGTVAEALGLRRRLQTHATRREASSKPHRRSAAPPTRPFGVGDHEAAPSAKDTNGISSADAVSPDPSHPELASAGGASPALPRKGGRAETSRVEAASRRDAGATTRARLLRFVELTNAALERRGAPLGLSSRLWALVRSRFFGRR